MNLNNIFEPPSFLEDCGNGIFLNSHEIAVLKNYELDPRKYNNIKTLMFDIEKILEYENIEELDQVLLDITERNYYQNTNK